MDASDFRSAFMTGFPLGGSLSAEMFSPNGGDCISGRSDLPVLAFGISTHAQVLGLRRVRLHLAYSGAADIAFPTTGRGQHTERMISELNGWPAFPFNTDAHHDVVTAVAPPLKAKQRLTKYLPQDESPLHRDGIALWNVIDADRPDKLESFEQKTWPSFVKKLRPEIE